MTLNPSHPMRIVAPPALVQHLAPLLHQAVAALVLEVPTQWHTHNKVATSNLMLNQLMLQLQPLLQAGVAVCSLTWPLLQLV